MPRKQRRSKRRLDPVAEAEAWACAFATGHDFHGDLEPFGFPWGGAEADAMRAAMPAAWARLGRLYLDYDMGRGFAPHDRGEPYALMQFGEPS